MLQTLHDKFSGPITWIILGLITIIFGGFFGVQQYASQHNETFAARVDGKEISQQEFRDRWNNYRTQLQRMYGAQFDAAVFDTPERRRELLDQMVNEQLILNANEKLGVAIPKNQIDEVIRNDPNFQVDGKFDPERARMLLAANNRTAAGYRQEVEHSIAIRQLPMQLAQIGTVTDAEVNSYLRLRDQTRDFRYVKIDKPAAGDVKIADADIEAYYKAHGDEFMAPEKVSLDYVEVDAAKLVPADVKPDEATLKQRYEDQKSRFVTAEEREVSHILVKVDKNADAAAQKAALEKAQGIANDAKGGKDFAALAKAQSDDLGSKSQGGDLGWIAKGVTDPAFESAVFSLKKGDVSDPVKSDEGYHVILVRDIRPEKTKPFEEVKGELAKQYADTERERQYSDLASKLTDAILQDPSSLAPAAKQLNLPVQKTGLFARTSGGEGIAANPAVIKAAFSNQVLVEGNTSDPVELGPNHTVFVHIDQHEKPTPKPLDQVREQIRQKLTNQQLAKQAQERADALYARLTKGEKLDDIAASLKLKVEEQKGIGRNAANVDQKLVTEAFKLARPEEDRPTVGKVALANDAFALVELDAVTDGDPAKADAKTRDAARNTLTQAYGGEAVRGFVDSLRKTAKIEIAEDRLQ
ncbi:MAG TPA: SurA N-terminal domain-containing protein [Rudaea sp.]